MRSNFIKKKKKNYLDFKSMDEDCQTRWKLFSGSYFVLILELRLFCQHMRSSFDEGLSQVRCLNDKPYGILNLN